MWGCSVLHPGHDTSCPYKNRCEFFNFTELRLDAIALLVWMDLLVVLNSTVLVC